MDALQDRLARLSPEQRARLVERLRSQQRGADEATPDVAAATIPRARRDEPLRLSFAQTRLWVLDRLEGERSDYRVPALWRLAGPLNVAALERSLAAIVRRHEVLRTTFADGPDGPVQVVDPEPSLVLRTIDLRAFTGEDQPAAVQRAVAAETRRPFDLTRGPLLRAALLQLGPDEHALLLVLHHIVCDGWSMAVLRSELARIYAGLCVGEAPALAPLPIQYADFAQWQRQQLQGPRLAAQLRDWCDQLAGAPPLLALPTDRPRPAVQSFRGGALYFKVDRALTDGLQRVARGSQATLYMTLLAAFALLLARHSRQDDVVVGSPSAGRTRRELEPMIGLFLNTLALRVRATGALTFRQLLAQVQRTALDALTHQDVPFERLVDELRLARSLSHNPLFQVMFALQNTPAGEASLPGLSLTALPLANVTTHFDLSLTMKETDEGLAGEWEYSSDLFDGATITRMMASYKTLLGSIVADSNQRVGALELLDGAERRRLLVDKNATAQAAPRDLCVPRMFELQARRTPEALAVLRPGGGSLTYRALDERADRLARHLRALGVGPGALVGLCVERSPELFVGLLGILKAGGAYVPLDPTYPGERLAAILQDAGIGVAVTQPRHVATLTALAAQPLRAVCMDGPWLAGDGSRDEPPLPAAQAADLAYVIYTSGSTGKPKGVMIEHGALINFVRAAAALYGLSGRDRCLQLATLNVDTAAEEVFPCLCSGATLVLSTDEMRGSMPAFVRESQAHGVTVWTLTHAFWDVLCGEVVDGRVAVPDAVRWVTIGSERAAPERVRQWLRRVGGGSRLMNVYGPSETTCFSTCSELSALSAEQLASGEMPIGRPIANTRVYVLDELGQLVPEGVTGELHIGGAGLARGYLNQPERTRERFIADPFSDEPGARLYRTGDLVRWRADGDLEFVGRTDSQVKIRGFRVEPGEIEAALQQHPQVAQVVVLARDGAGHKHLVAYVVPRDAALTAAALRRSLEHKLPAYMVPGAFVVLPALPLTANGKVDHRALPEPDPTTLGQRPTFVPPTTATEARLAEIWAEVLRLPRVGVHDNFFTLGGDSILSIQVVSRAIGAGLPIQARHVFLHQTIAELAAALDAGAAGSAVAEQGLVTGAVPLAPIQRVFFEVPQRDPQFFNLSVMLEPPADVQPALLGQAVAHLLAHHDALRLRFVQRGGTWQQDHADLSAEVPFRTIDLSRVPAAEQAAAQRAADRELQASLDLTAGPLVRAGLLQFGADRPGRLILVVHHLAMDIVSWWILVEDLLRAYEALRRGQAVQLPAKTTSFKEWSRRMTAHAQTCSVRAELDYWLAAASTQAPPLALDFPRSVDDNVFAHMDRVYLDLSAEETAVLLQELPARHATQIGDVLLTAFVQAFAGVTGERSLLVELSSHGREALLGDMDLTRTVGWFVSAYPLRIELADSDDPLGSLRAVKDQLRGVPHQGLGYGLLRYLHEDPEVRRRLCALPEAAVTFAYFGQSDQILQGFADWSFAADDRPSFYSPRTERGQYVFNVHGVVLAGRLRVSWTFSRRMHRRETVARLAEAMFVHLRVLLNAPARG